MHSQRKCNSKPFEFEEHLENGVNEEPLFSRCNESVDDAELRTARAVQAVIKQHEVKVNPSLYLTGILILMHLPDMGISFVLERGTV